ncbi:hypothetical protein H6P81_018739 [Aristolochia fimbriata]|uniref:Uncharacterized protein n=1 Tax=Aristolochia fimbriata TaxID=158543 RepID=A0AAV7E437_ARIFI|nr:hypothetical protein H6P81_018739 [Aristolochia fimbriata]
MEQHSATSWGFSFNQGDIVLQYCKCHSSVELQDAGVKAADGIRNEQLCFVLSPFVVLALLPTTGVYPLLES